jgi:hypothetical protein
MATAAAAAMREMSAAETVCAASEFALDAAAAVAADVANVGS